MSEFGDGAALPMMLLFDHCKSDVEGGPLISSIFRQKICSADCSLIRSNTVYEFRWTCISIRIFFFTFFTEKCPATD